jgi:hypothetical protein
MLYIQNKYLGIGVVVTLVFEFPLLFVQEAKSIKMKDKQVYFEEMAVFYSLLGI